MFLFQVQVSPANLDSSGVVTPLSAYLLLGCVTAQLTARMALMKCAVCCLYLFLLIAVVGGGGGSLVCVYVGGSKTVQGGVFQQFLKYNQAYWKYQLLLGYCVTGCCLSVFLG